MCTISDGKARTSHLCCSVAVLWIWCTLKDHGHHSVDWKRWSNLTSLGCEHRWLPSCILGVLRNMARRSGIMNWPLISQMTGPSLFGGLDSGLDCGTGLWDWTQRKLCSSFRVTESTQEICSFQLFFFFCLYGSMQRKHWGQAIAAKC